MVKDKEIPSVVPTVTQCYTSPEEHYAIITGSEQYSVTLPTEYRGSALFSNLDTNGTEVSILASVLISVVKLHARTVHHNRRQ